MAPIPFLVRRGRLLCALLYALCALPVLASPPPHWHIYSGVNTVYSIAVGRQFVWAATDGGVLVCERRTGRIRHLDGNDGLPGKDVRPITLDPDDGDSLWCIVQGGGGEEADGRQYNLARLTLRDLRSTLRLQVWPFPRRFGTQIDIDYQYYGYGQGGPPVLTIKPDDIQWEGAEAVWHFHRKTRAWSTVERSPAERDAWIKRHEDPQHAENVSQIIADSAPDPTNPGGLRNVRHIYLLDHYDSVRLLVPGRGFVGDFSLANSGNKGGDEFNAGFSVPFHLRIDPRGALTYDVIATRRVSLPEDLYACFYMRLTWKRAPDYPGGWKLAARSPISPELLPTLQAEAARSLTAQPTLASLQSLTDIVFDPQTNLLWLGGKGGLVRYDPIAGRGFGYPRQPEELRLGVGAMIHDFVVQDGHPVLIATANDSDRGEITIRADYLPECGAWTQRILDSYNANSSGYPRTTRPVRVSWPSHSGATPDTKFDVEESILAARGDWLWLDSSSLIFKGGERTSGYQPLTLFNDATGHQRVFPELSGFSMLAVAPVGDGKSAWLLTAPIIDYKHLGPRTLFYYDSATDKLTRVDTPLLGVSGNRDRPDNAKDPSLLAAAPDGAALAGVSGLTGPLVRVTPPTGGQPARVEAIPLPPGSILKALPAEDGGADRVVIVLDRSANPNWDNTALFFWQPDPRAPRLLPLPTPSAAVLGLEPTHYLLIGNRLWLAGHGVASIDLPDRLAGNLGGSQRRTTPRLAIIVQH